MSSSFHNCRHVAHARHQTTSSPSRKSAGYKTTTPFRDSGSAPDCAAPPSVETWAFVKPVVLHAPPCILARPTRCHRRTRNIHRPRARLRRVQPAISLYPELGLHGHQPATRHLLLRGPCTTLQSRGQTGIFVLRLPLVGRSLGVKAPFTAVRGQGRHRELPGRQDEGPHSVDLLIIHGLQTPDFGVCCITVHHRGRII